MLLRPRGMHGVRRGRARELDLTGPMPKGRPARHGGQRRPPPRRPRMPRTAEPPAPPRPSLEKPPPSAGRMVRLRARLARSQSGFGSTLLALLSRDRLDDETWDEIEDVLITADVGVTPARTITSDLRTKVKVEGTKDPRRGQGDAQDRAARPGGDPGQPRAADPAARGPPGGRPRGRRQRHRQDHHLRQARQVAGRRRQTVVLGAADTFRAAAADQLQTWGSGSARRSSARTRTRPTRPASPSTRCPSASSRRPTWCSSTPRGACTPRTT